MTLPAATGSRATGLAVANGDGEVQFMVAQAWPTSMRAVMAL